MKERKYQNNRIFILNDQNAPRISPALATEIGLNESIILLQLEFRIATSGHEEEGKLWTYQSINDLKEQFPFWSRETINRAISSLAKKKLITIGNFNKYKYDRTRWFSLNYDSLSKLKSLKIWGYETRSSQNETGSGQFETAPSQNETTIPDTSPDTSSETNSTHQPPLPTSPEDDKIIKWFLSTLPQRWQKDIKGKTIREWYETLDKCQRIDGYSLKQVKEILEWIRDDNFWNKNFFSISKLRKRNKDGIKYIDYFEEKMRQDFAMPTNGSNKSAFDRELENLL